MIIGFDVDDVLIDTNPYLLIHLNRRFGTNIKDCDISDYFMQGLFGDNKEEAEAEIYKYISEKGEFLPPMPGAKSIIKRLSVKNEIIAITARQDAERITRTCLDREFNGAIKEIYFAGLTGKERKSKKEVVSDRGIEFFVDDRLDYALQCAEVCKRVLILDKPWNQNGLLPENVRRTYNWGEIFKECLNSRKDSTK